MATPTLGIGQTFGATSMLIGGLIAMVIYGITTLQMYFYFIHYPKDSLGLKALVATTWTLDTLHTALIFHSLYTYLILGSGNPRVLVNGTWSLFVSLAVNVLLVVIAQGFFTLRIYRLSRRKIKWILSGVIGFTVFAHFCFGIETVVYFFKIAELSKLSKAMLRSLLPLAITAVISDILIASALCFLLERSRTNIKDTNNLITKLIVIAINQCVLTCAMDITGMIVRFLKPESLFGIDFIVGKLYANSLLATLNARRSLGRGAPEASDIFFTSFRIALAATDHGHISLDENATQDDIDNYRGRSLDVENKRITTHPRLNTRSLDRPPAF